MGEVTELRKVRLKSAAAFIREFVPLSYVIEGIARSASLYTVTAKTGGGKTGLFVATALAVATGRPDILGREVTRGRVVYMSFENPDDVRMRFAVAAYLYRIDLDELGDDIAIIDVRKPPEAAIADIKATKESTNLVLVDTLAAAFDGADINDAVQGGQFMRRLRPLTQLPGLPTVMVAAHPIKNASEDQLVPYGSGAILNEADGNLTISKSPATGYCRLHWQGKLRGLEFEPVNFRSELFTCPDIVDDKGRQVQLPVLRPCSEVDVEEREAASLNSKRRLLDAMVTNPNGTQADWGDAIGHGKSLVNKHLRNLEKDGLVESSLGRWKVTAKGKKAFT